MSRPDTAERQEGDPLRAWLEALGLLEHFPSFVANDVEFDLLPDLTADDLKELGVVSIGHRRRILTAAAALRATGATGAAPASAPDGDARAEQRIVTAMFCDMVGSTRLSTLLEPEDYRDLIDCFRGHVESALVTFNCHSMRFLGDGVVAFFGLAGDQEQGAEIAVAAALEIVRRLDAAPSVAGHKPVVRVGIATGMTIVEGPGADPTAGENSIVGETPNLAARLQAEADPGSVLISHPTRERLGGLFRCEDAGLRRLKGIEEPVRTWRVFGHEDTESRFDALRLSSSAGHGFVGREAELARLRRRSGHAAAGGGCISLILGPSGIGKSRLAREVLSVTGPAAQAPLVLQCMPYHVANPFHPLRRFIQRQLRPGQQDADLRPSIEGLLAGCGIVDKGRSDLLTDFMSNAAAPIETRSESQERRAQFLALLVEVMLAIGRRSGGVLVEDVHWMDPSTAEVLARIARRIGAEPLHLICTMRDGPVPDWCDSASSEIVYLDRLPASATRDLVRRFVRGRQAPPLADDQVEDIVGRSDGNPVFAEELTRYVLGVVAGGGEIAQGLPATLGDSLMARLDSLSGGKRLAQVAAVIAHEFPKAVLFAVADQPEEDVRKGLDVLIGAGVLQVGHSPFGEAVAFSHMLLQEAAYTSLLRRDRVVLHNRIARTLVESFPAVVEALPQVIAHHHGKAGNPLEAAAYWDRAGTQAARRSAYAEAIGLFQRALDEVGSAKAGPDTDRLEVGVRLNRVAAFVASSGFNSPPVIAEMRHLDALGEAMQRDHHLFGLLLSKWVFAGASCRFSTSLEIARQLRDLGDSAGEVERLIGHRAFGTSLLFAGRFADARRELLSFMERYDPSAHAAGLARYGTSSHEAMTAVGLAELALLSCDDDAARHWAERATGHAAASGQAHDLCNVTLFIGCILPALRGSRRSIAPATARLRELATRHDLPVWLAHADLFAAIADRSDQGLQACRDPIAQIARSHSFLGFCIMFHAEACIERGLVAEARHSFGLINARMISEENWLSAELARIDALIARGEGATMEEVSARLDRAEAIAARQDARLFRLKIDSTRQSVTREKASVGISATMR